MNDDPKHATTILSGVHSGDPSSLPSKASPPDSQNAPKSSQNAANLFSQSPSEEFNDQKGATGTSATNGSKAGSDCPQPLQHSDQTSMEPADFNELKAKVEEERERSVQTFHVIAGVLDRIHAEVQYIYSEFLTQQYQAIEGELGRFHEESNRRLQEQERLQQQLAQFLTAMKEAFSIFG